MKSPAPASAEFVAYDAAPEPSTRWALASLALSAMLAAMGTSIANVGLPMMAQAFAASFQAVQWIVLAYLLAITTLIVSVGRLGDLVGRRRLLLAGIVVFSLGSLLCGLAPSLALLVAARAIQGVGAAIMMALSLAFVGEIVPKDRTGSAMGLLGTMSAIGTALGPSLGGTLIAALDWRAIFLVNLPLGILAFLFARHTLPADRHVVTLSHPGFDAIGSMLLALTLAAYALAMTLGRGQFGSLNLGLLLVAAVGAGLFILVEAKVAHPLIRLSVFRERGLAASLIMSVLVATVMMSTLVVGPFYLTRGLGIDAAMLGFVMSVGPLAAAIAGVPAGRLTDRLGATRMTRIGLAGVASGCLALTLLPGESGTAGYLGAMVVITIGYALFQTANNTAVMSGVNAERRGLASGMLNLSRNLGLVTGASVMGAVFATAAGTVEIASAPASAVATGMRFTFAVAAALVVLALLIASMVRHHARHLHLSP